MGRVDESLALERDVNIPLVVQGKSFDVFLAGGQADVAAVEVNAGVDQLASAVHHQGQNVRIVVIDHHAVAQREPARVIGGHQVRVQRADRIVGHRHVDVIDVRVVVIVVEVIVVVQRILARAALSRTGPRPGARTACRKRPKLSQAQSWRGIVRYRLVGQLLDCLFQRVLIQRGEQPDVEQQASFQRLDLQRTSGRAILFA